MTLVFIPPLITLLLSEAQAQGASLNEREVIGIRDSATVINVTPEVALMMAESRGYRDIDPENCWAEWLAFIEAE